MEFVPPANGPARSNGKERFHQERYGVRYTISRGTRISGATAAATLVAQPCAVDKKSARITQSKTGKTIRGMERHMSERTAPGFAAIARTPSSFLLLRP